MYLRLGIEEELVVLPTDFTNGSNVQKQATVSDLLDVDTLKAHRENGQQVIMQKHACIMSKMDVIVLEDGSGSDDPVIQPDDEERDLLDHRDACHGASGSRGVGIRRNGRGEDAIQVVLRGQEEVLADDFVDTRGQWNVVQQCEVALELVGSRGQRTAPPLPPRTWTGTTATAAGTAACPRSSG